MSVVTVALAFLILSICLVELYSRYRARNVPPGITGLWFFVELMKPKGKPWLRLNQHNQKYGDIASMSLCGFNIIAIGSAKIAVDLLEKRGIKYSDRPRSVMAGELAGWGKMLLLCNYSDWLRTQRKWLAHDLGSHAAVACFHRMIELETRRTLRSVLDSKDLDGLQIHVRKNFSSIMLRLSHGYITQEGDDPLVELAELANSQLSKATAPGAYYVDIIPFLKYIPSWFPGAGFKRTAAEYAAVAREALETPHQYVVDQLAAGTALPSFSCRLLSMSGLTEHLEDDVKWTALTMYRAGVDTSTSIAYAFYLAMTLHPHVLRKAQQKLDMVVGTSQLPTFTDRPSLPYLEALFTELLRWQAPGPIIMRRTREEDVYDGYVIPADSYVFVNVWAMLRDERTYKDPLEFKPERFLGDDPEPHPSNICFGFGRRRCPGIFFAQSTLWLMCAQSLAAFDISKCVEDGVEVTPEFDQVGGLFLKVAPFKCSIKPRSETAERLINDTYAM